MPRVRVLGNAALSILTKFSSGYWQIFDPTNGYTAIHSRVAALLPFKDISKRFVFETHVLFCLAMLRAVVLDIPITSHYKNSSSNLRIYSALWLFFSLTSVCLSVEY